MVGKPKREKRCKKREINRKGHDCENHSLGFD